MRLVHGSTFIGIGGPEVAAAMLGWENAFHCEINPFGRKILDYYFPNAKSYEDITTTDFSEWRGKIDVLTGGFPCQPFSYAGKRKGANDDRYLWPFMLKCIDQVRPTWFIGENVAGITTMVLPGETTEMGGSPTLFDEGDHYLRTEQPYVIETICRELEAIGYSVQPLLIPACAVGAPHRRDRVFFLAHNERDAPYHTDLRDDGAETRNASGTEGAQRVQERDNLRRPGVASQVRPEGDGTPQDPNAVRCGQREVQESQHTGLTGNDCPASNERRVGYVAPDTTSNGRDGLQRTTREEREVREESQDRQVVLGEGHGVDIHTDPQRIGIPRPSSHTDCGGEGASGTSGSTQGSGCHGDAESGERSSETQRTDGSLEIPRYAPDSSSERQGGCDESRSECSLQGEMGDREGNHSQRNLSVEADGCGRTPTNTESEPSQPTDERGSCCKGEIQLGGGCGEGSGCYGLPWCGLVTDTDCNRGGEIHQHLQPQLADGNESLRNGREWNAAKPEWCGDYLFHRWDSFPTVSPIHRGNDGLPFDVDYLTIPLSKWRASSLMAYGNAIVPQIMAELFIAIEATYVSGNEH